MRSLNKIIALVVFWSMSIDATADPTPSIHFIENKNQWSCSIDFAARVGGGDMFIETGRFRYYFLDGQKLDQLHHRSHEAFDESRLAPSETNEIIDGRLIDVNFLNSNKNSVYHPFGKLPFYYNYFLGSDKEKWASQAGANSGIMYESMYEGIDLKIYSQGEHVKYDWIVKPGANPASIETQYMGSDQIKLVDENLVIQSPVVTLTEMKPVAFQWIDGKQVYVKCRYVLFDNIVSFDFPEGYDACNELIIDPLLIFSTYSGSTADNWGSSATPGERGTLYSSGVTNHNHGGALPVTPGAFQTSYGGLYDVAILKYDSSGQHLLYASYLGGNESESPHSLVMNAQGELVVLGTTGSLNFPTTTGAFDRNFNGGQPESNVIEYTNGSDIFVAKISQDGSQLVASTYLGGSANDGLNPSDGILVKNYGDQLRGDIITNEDGDILISSVSSSPDFPVANSFNTTFKGGDTDGLLLKLSPDLSQIRWGAFLGGADADASHTIKLDQSNTIYVGGGTTSTDFPITAGSYQTVQKGDADGWIAKISADGTTILAATFTGTAGFNQVYFLDLNEQGEIYVYGQTVGAFPVTVGTYNNPNSGQFVQKFKNDLSAVLFSTVFGSGRGFPDISPTAFLVNDCNNLYMSGWGGEINSRTGHWNSNTFGMPVSPDGYQKTTSGSDFYFIVLTQDASQFLYGTYLGGTQSRTHVDGGTSRFDKSGVVYHAVCSGCSAVNATGHSTSDFPTTSNAWSKINKSTNCNNAAFKFDLSSLKARIQTNNLELSKPGYNVVCLPDKIVFQNLSTGGEVYRWDFGDGTSEEKTSQDDIVHQYKETGTYKVKLKAIDQGTCVGKDSTYATVNVYKPLGYASDDKSICFGSSTQLVAGGGVKYEWTSSSGKFKSQLAGPVISPKADSSYFATITDVRGCVNKDTVIVKVVPGIDLKYELKRQIPDCFSRATLSVTNLTDPQEEVFFDFGDGTTSDLDETVHAYESDGIYLVRLVGRKDFCIYEKSEQIPIYSVKVPNVITPEQSPGKNDTFKIYGETLPVSSGIAVSLKIYNRWGEIVYEDDEYKDSWSATGLAAGVYYYDLRFDQEKLTCKGWVQVIK